MTALFFLITCSFHWLNSPAEILEELARRQSVPQELSISANDEKQGRPVPVDTFPMTTIRLRFQQAKRVPEALFIDQMDTVRVIDPLAESPYRSWPYPLKYMAEDDGDYRYDLSLLEQDERLRLLLGMRLNEAAFVDSSYLKAWVETPVVDVQGRVLALGYQVSFYSSPEDVIGTQGEALVYTAGGHEPPVRIIDRQDGFYGLSLSADGAFLLQVYGVEYGEDGSGRTPSGFKLYQLEGGGSRLFSFDLAPGEVVLSYGHNNAFPGFHVVTENASNTYWYFLFPGEGQYLWRQWVRPVDLDHEMAKLQAWHVADAPSFLESVIAFGFQPLSKKP
jgi:hypothetical protein